MGSLRSRRGFSQQDVMKHFPRLFTVLCSSGIALLAPSQPSQRPDRASTPAEYSARTDRKAVPYPETPPAIGAAGSIITDPSFGSRIARVTDARSDPKGEGRSLFTPSSAEQTPWNKTSTLFYVDTSGGAFLLYDFDPVTMRTRLARAPNLAWTGEPQFSYQHASILYGMVRRDTVFQQYDVATGKLSDVNNASKCVKVQSSDTGGSVTVSADDNRFMTSLGPMQDKNYMVYVFDRSLGCRWYNTETGEIGGQWGPKGIISASDRFLIHNARMAKSGKYLYVTRGGGPGVGKGWVVWEIDTMNVGVCPRGCSGHHVLGYTHILGASGLSHPLDIWLRPLNHLENSSPIITGLEPAKNFWYDSHYSWSNVDPDDSAPVCFSTYRPTNPDTPGAPLLVTGPWENEIDCAETDGKGSKLWRFAHTYSTARNGFWSSPRGNVSQDGRFFMFTSDWQDQLGKQPHGTGYRSDVFIVELR
jgi:hypothetical protein